MEGELEWSGVWGRVMEGGLEWSGVWGRVMEGGLEWSGVWGRVMEGGLEWSGVWGRAMEGELEWSGVWGRVMEGGLEWSGVWGRVMEGELEWSGVWGRVMKGGLEWSGVWGRVKECVCLHMLHVQCIIIYTHGNICPFIHNLNRFGFELHVLIRDEILMIDEKEGSKVKQTTRQSNTAHPRQSLFLRKMKGTKVQTLGGRAVAGAWLVAWAVMAIGAIINTHAHR